MASGFPLYVDLTGNNCTVFGGGRSALRRVRELLRFGAKVTVIAPQLCPELREMSDRHELRHIPRKYYRGDCTNAQLCVAATDDRTVNIAISTEAKAKAVPVNVTSPAAYGNFHFPRVVLKDGVSLAVAGDLPPAQMRALRDILDAELPKLLRRAAAVDEAPAEDEGDTDEELAQE